MDPASGFGVAIWQEVAGSAYSVQAATLPLNGSWSSPSVLDPATQMAQTTFYPIVATYGVSYAYAAWQERVSSGVHIIQASSLLPQFSLEETLYNIFRIRPIYNAEVEAAETTFINAGL